MIKVPPASFSPELVTIMKSALDTAVDRIDRSHRTPATKAKMAQRIVRTASEGVTDLHKRDVCQRPKRSLRRAKALALNRPFTIKTHDEPCQFPQRA
jgi:hypothetical protein